MSEPLPMPSRFADEAELEDFMTAPDAALIADLGRIDGDILVLGAGGKMGPTLARAAKRAAPGKRVVAVARFSQPGLVEGLVGWGIETIACDLLDREAVARLPRLANVIYMAGRKFGEQGSLDVTWAMNVLVPGYVADTFRDSRIVVFSTGCVYPFVPVTGGGATEATPATPPPGDYANSCVGRERAFEFFSNRHGTRGRLIRLNYAIDMRYGVLHDVARKVMTGTTIDVTTGHVNVIWQGDANAVALRSLGHCASPPPPLNVSGPETVSIRVLAEAFGKRLGKTPLFAGQEAATGWLVNTSACASLFGYPRVSLGQMTDWVADWVARAGPSHGKPTQYEVRSGVFAAPKPPPDTLAFPDLEEVSLKGFRPADGVRLSSEPGWNQIEDDWTFMVGHGDSFGMVADDGRPVASGVTVPFDTTYGWISMILVTAAYRRRGLATHMMNRCIEALHRRGLTPALDATPAGRQVYMRLGFRDVYTLTRYLVPAGRPPRSPTTAMVRPLTEADLDRLTAYDRDAFGATRGFLLRHLWSRLPDAAMMAEINGRIRGFVLGRKGRKCDQIGPLVADDDATASALLDAALTHVPGAVCLDVGDHHSALRARLAGLGAATVVPFIRMIEGRAEPFDDPKRIFVIGGPELA